MKNSRLSDSMKKCYKSTKRIKRTKNNNANECVLDSLPDHILVYIISFLSLKDIIATSTLSTRWRNLWKFSRISLNFDAYELYLKHHSFESANNNDSNALIENLLDDKRESFVDMVNSVVNQFGGKIDSFRVCYHLTHEYGSSIDKWVKFSMSSRTLETLELDLSGPGLTKNCYRFTKTLFSDKGLYMGLMTLKELCLDSVCVSGTDIEYMLCNAPVLKSLTVRNSPELVSLRVSGHSLALECLTIRMCERLEKVEICEVNIAKLCIDGGFETSNFILRDLPQLDQLCVQFVECSSNFTQLFYCCLSQLVTLHLVDCVRGNKYDEDDAYPTIPYLKHLYLSLCTIDDEEDGGLSNLRLLLEAFPNLEILVLHAPDYYSDMEKRPKIMPNKAPKRRHKYLKEVRIIEYSGKYGDFERLMYLIQHAVALEKIIVDCEYENGTRREKSMEKLHEDEQAARSHAMNQLWRAIPPYIEFVCN